ncbi:MAG: fumarate hydratase class II [Mariniblastus sp.]
MVAIFDFNSSDNRHILGKSTMPEKLYGSETELAFEHFSISGLRFPSDVITELARIKKHAAAVNVELGEISSDVGYAIQKAAQSIQDGEHSEQFIVDLFQTGSGTSTNMNLNEVIANLATTDLVEVKANDHVNCSQSSNDVIPTAIQLACLVNVQKCLLPSLERLSSDLRSKGQETWDVVTTARTHLMDAVPIRFGNVLTSFADLLDCNVSVLQASSKRLGKLPLGGTAAGTGLNAHPEFAARTITRIANEINEAEGCSIELLESEDHIGAQSCPIGFLGFSGALRESSIVLSKLANDFRFLNSGPSAGFGDIRLKKILKGSSIMPGKVNPVLCESMMQVSMYVRGADATVQSALAEASNFQLNTAFPLTAHMLLTSIKYMTNVCKLFAKNYIRPFEMCDELRKSITIRTSQNPMLVTALNRECGYKKGEEICALAEKNKISILEAAVLLLPERNATDLREILNPNNMC